MPVKEAAPDTRRRAALALHVAAIGIVFGDIGTSPLYTIRQCFDPLVGLKPEPDDILGAVSLVFWSITLVVSLKYVFFVMRADNRGEGGILALAALTLDTLSGKKKRVRFLPPTVIVALGMVGAALFYGDGVITPAISVLGAIEGLHVIVPTPDFVSTLIAVVLLVALFYMQRRGTGGIGKFFGPVMVTWFAVIGLIGLVGIFNDLSILAAISPHYGLNLIFGGHAAPLALLGAVVLAVTGAEALYADMGHFGRPVIQRVWFYLVWPALILNYMGQGALLLSDPTAVTNPFYLLVPDLLRIPLILLATMAAITASQAVISGAFSLTAQAVELGWLPRLRVTHTSAAEAGQIYVNQVNWILGTAVILTVLFFESSDNLAAAYGLAVTGTMGLTSFLYFLICWRRWNWPLAVAIGLVALFLLVDLSFLTANLTKFFDGGMLPVGIALGVLLLMWTWIKGRRLLAEDRQENRMTTNEFLEMDAVREVTRVKGVAVFLTADTQTVPTALLTNFKHNQVLHKRVVFVQVSVAAQPRVPLDEQIRTEKLSNGFAFIELRHGFMQPVDVPRMLDRCKTDGLEFPERDTHYFVSRELLVRGEKSRLPAWQAGLFILLTDYQLGSIEFFRLPPEQVIEIGSKSTV